MKTKLFRLHPSLRDAAALIFDAGGTLVHPDWQRLAEFGKAETGQVFSPVEMRHAFYEALRRVDTGLHLSHADLGHTRQPHWLFLDMFRTLGLETSDFEGLRARIDKGHRERHIWCERDSEVLNVISRLKQTHLRIAVISNTEDGRLEESLELAEIACHFEFLIDSHAVGLRKPSTAIFHLALDTLGIRPEDAVYLGDSYGYDVVGAQKAGLRAILLDPLDLYENLEVDRIRRLTELVEFG